MKKNQSAVVTGKLAFPIDMLRYDQCFPASEQDAIKIENSISKAQLHDLKNINTSWSITINKKGSNPFSVERWQSFGCDIQPQ